MYSPILEDGQKKCIIETSPDWSGRMSDFTCANLILLKDVEIAKKYLEPNSYLIELNKKWVCLLTENDLSYNDVGGKTFSDDIIALSEEAPVLFFINAEDHGAEYNILHKGKSLGSLSIQHDLIPNSAIEIASEMHGDEEGFEKWMNAPEEFDKLAIEKNREYISQNFSDLNLEGFKVFGFPDSVIDELKELLTAANFLDMPSRMCRTLMTILELRELCFVSWHYASKDDRAYSIIAKA